MIVLVRHPVYDISFSYVMTNHFIQRFEERFSVLIPSRRGFKTLENLIQESFVTDQYPIPRSSREGTALNVVFFEPVTRTIIPIGVGYGKHKLSLITVYQDESSFCVESCQSWADWVFHPFEIFDGAIEMVSERYELSEPDIEEVGQEVLRDYVRTGRGGETLLQRVERIVLHKL